MNSEEAFQEAMETLAKMHERSKVFVDFMDYYIYQNSKSRERRLPNGYKEKEMQLFDTAYNNFQSLMSELIAKHGWYDYLGEYYESYILGNAKASQKGQFYTPRQISTILSRIVGCDVSMPDAYDCACGSARNLIEYHSKHPTTRCFGEDLDESACKMAVINFSCHSVNGVVNWIDALTREYMGTSWKTIDGRVYITDIGMIRANEEILQSISLLSLSDNTIHDLLVLASTVLNNTGEKPSIVSVETDEVKGGLDAWL